MSSKNPTPTVDLRRANGQPSEKYCQCATCGEAFTTVALFDRHRVGKYAKPGQMRGTRRCMTTAEMEAKGWNRNRRSFWRAEAISTALLQKMQESLRTKATTSPA